MGLSKNKRSFFDRLLNEFVEQFAKPKPSGLGNCETKGGEETSSNKNTEYLSPSLAWKPKAKQLELRPDEKLIGFFILCGHYYANDPKAAQSLTTQWFSHVRAIDGFAEFEEIL